jgi:uncharacterized DUF497 family protein
MVEFDRDEEKSRLNKAKHGWDFARAARIFGDPFGLCRRRPNTGDELRFRITGIVNGQIITVIYTERSGAFRLISARKATSRERKNYENFIR